MARTDEKKQLLGSFMNDTNGTMCLAYSEIAHASDLLGGDMQATKVSAGYLLNGEKWPIKRANISIIAFVLGKTDPQWPLPIHSRKEQN